MKVYLSGFTNDFGRNAAKFLVDLMVWIESDIYWMGQNWHNQAWSNRIWQFQLTQADLFLAEKDWLYRVKEFFHALTNIGDSQGHKKSHWLTAYGLFFCYNRSIRSIKTITVVFCLAIPFLSHLMSNLIAFSNQTSIVQFLYGHHYGYCIETVQSE